MRLEARVIEQIGTRVDGLRDWIVETTCRLVRIPTVNPYSGDSSAGRETPGQVEMVRLLEGLGANVRTVPVPDDVFARCGVLGPAPRDYRDRYNVVGRLRFGRGGRSVLLNCHMDTVGVAGYQGEPFGGQVKDGRIFGRGATDSKGNLVVGLAAIKALRMNGLALNGDVWFESVVDEECNGSGGGTLADRLAGIRADACICLDGAGLYPCIGCSGVATAAVDVFGKGGHAARGAVNAIDKAVRVKLAVDRLAQTRRAMQPPQLMNLGIFRAGTLPAVVPDQAHLEYNISYALVEAQEAYGASVPATPTGCASRSNEYQAGMAPGMAPGGWDGRLVRQQFEEAVALAANEDSWLAEHAPKVTWIKDLYPFQTDADEAIVRAAVAAYEAVLGASKPPAPMGAWFDGAHIAVCGQMPVVGMGAGAMAAAHAQTEWIVIEDQVANAKAVALAIHAYLTGVV